MTQPGDGIAADTGALGRLYASRFDRVQVINALRSAFVQGRLTEDECDARVDQASAARNHAELAALLADIPAGSATARPPTATDARIGVGVVVAAATLLGLLLWWQPGNGLAVIAALLAAVTVITGTPITVGLMIDSRHQRRSSRQLPPLPPRSTGD
ncbi:MAG: DUF1707 domain-containing protein [Streptosporangiaceae bacterium]|jgi:hypothetical protein